MYSSDFVSSMKLLLVIFVAVISVSSSHSSISTTNDQESTSTTATTTRDQIRFPCPHGYRLDFDKCVEIIMVGLVCPVEKGKNEGDRCVISSKHCPSGYYLLEDHQTCVKDDEEKDDEGKKDEEKAPGKYGCDLNYSFDEEKGVCSKDVDIGAPDYKCFDYFTRTDRTCVGHSRKPFEICEDDSNSPKGCQPRRIEKVFDTCDLGYEPDRRDPHWCVFTPTFGPLWCPHFFRFFFDNNVCDSQYDSIEDDAHCKYGYVKKGRCVETKTMKSKWTCSSKPEMANRSIGKFKLATKPIVVCFEGIISEGVCKGLESVQPVSGCPEGYSADSAGKECNLDNTTTESSL